VLKLQKPVDCPLQVPAGVRVISRRQFHQKKRRLPEVRPPCSNQSLEMFDFDIDKLDGHLQLQSGIRHHLWSFRMLRARPSRLLKKYFPGSFRTESGLQVLESSFAGMIEITKLIHSSAAC
jgi:hypothetical protein